MTTPAKLLAGLTLTGQESQWKVIRELTKQERGSGGYFSASYVVENQNGGKAFLKAMDYADAFNSNNVPAALLPILQAYQFERNLLRVCLAKNLDRIIRVLDEGQFDVPNAPNAKIPTVNFLVFELADGNVSDQVDVQRRVDRAISLRLLHDVSVGLRQLHSNGITHQDLRPSNVLHFRQEIAKLADLGRASSQTHPAAHDSLDYPGARFYAPPEFRYKMDRGNVSQFDWRRSGDLFLLGSMIFFMFEGQMLLPVMQSYLRPEHTCDQWTGSYEAVLPFLQNAFGQALSEFSRNKQDEVGKRITTALAQLAEPDPRRRGHPANAGRGQDQYSLERYVALLDLLAREAA